MPGAVITGAGRGLGRAIAAELAGRGFAVHVTDVDGDAAERVAAELGGSAFASALDVRDEEACRAVAAATAERAGSLDVWVNNAGVLVTGDAWEGDEAERRLVMDVNAHGTFNGTLAALEPMRAAGRGHIVNVISLAGLVTAPGEVIYSASKHAAIAFTLGTRFDLRRAGVEGVELTALCPDGIWTPMIAGRLDDRSAAPSFSGHLLTPEEVAAEVGRILERPRPLVTIPRWRGATVRVIGALPGLMLRCVPLLLRDAERRQRRYKKRIETGRWP